MSAYPPNTTPISSAQNGRVRIDDEVFRGKFALHETGDPSSASSLPFAQQALQSIHVDTPLNQTFFSRDNQQTLQNAIRRRVYEKSEGQHIISEQDDTQLQIVMRSIFLQYALHRDDDIAGQIRDLNERVLEYCVPIVYSNLLQYIGYKRDISRIPVPLEHAVNVSQAGSKTLSGFHMI